MDLHVLQNLLNELGGKAGSLSICLVFLNSGDLGHVLITFANNLDPD